MNPNIPAFLLFPQVAVMHPHCLHRGCLEPPPSPGRFKTSTVAKFVTALTGGVAAVHRAAGHFTVGDLYMYGNSKEVLRSVVTSPDWQTDAA